MVLTEKQRSDLHSGIYEYLLSRPGDAFARAAAALLEADPTAADKTSSKSTTNSATPLLEKKWTAVSRLQKKVLELERAASQNAVMYSHRGGGGSRGGSGAGGVGGKDGKRRMLPRPPAAHCLKGHNGNITCVEVHPVFTVVCSGSEDATVKIWDHESGEYMKTLKGHTSTVHSLSFTPTGSHLASSSSDLSIKIWDFKTYSCIRTLRGHDHSISAVRFLPPLLSNNPTNATPAPPDDDNLPPPSATTSSSSVTLASCSRDKTVKFWDLESGFCVSTTNYHSDWVRCVACRPDGSLIATSGNDSLIVLYNRDYKNVGELRGCEHVVESVAFLAAGGGGGGQPRIPGAERYLVSGGRDRCVRLWNTMSKECLSVFSYHENWVRSVLIHPSANFIISAGDDRSIRVIDIKSNRCLRTIENAHDHFVTTMSMHHTLPILVSGSVDQTVKCWILD